MNTKRPNHLAGLLAEDARERAAAKEGGAPTDEELVEYLEGKLEPAEESRIQTLAVSDPETAQRLLELQELLAAERGESGPANDLATEAGWRDFQERRRENVQPAPRLSQRLFPWAAALLLAAVNLGGWMTYTSRITPRLVANLTSLQLAEPGRSASLPVAEVDAGEPLRLVLRPETRCESYRAVIRGPKEGHRQEVSDLRLDELSLLTLLLPVKDGEYRLELLGCEPEERLEEHRFRVQNPGATNSSAP
ncbi:MAG: hypothetical protein SX243_03715 [Acidobacteriota bacterium]|nr:hypothetical protein [Acidobacteriota bacterium]